MREKVKVTDSIKETQRCQQNGGKIIWKELKKTALHNRPFISEQADTQYHLRLTETIFNELTL
jgi:hypothetical protein